MFCRNCRKDIGNRTECPYCGYDPALDSVEGGNRIRLIRVEPKPVQITLNKMSNGSATAALVFSFMGIFIFPGFISFILAIIGFFRAKRCRSGRAQSVIAMLILAGWTVLYCVVGFIIYYYASGMAY